MKYELENANDQTNVVLEVDLRLLCARRARARAPTQHKIKYKSDANYI